MRIAIVGDPHFDLAVRSRRDDYLQTCLLKLDEISNNADVIIFLGDFFNTPVVRISVLLPLMQQLQKYRNTGKFIATIPGNHDLYNEREESLNTTSLGILNTTNLVSVIDYSAPIIFGDYNFYSAPVNLGKAKEFLKNFPGNLNQDRKNVLLLHLYYEDRYEGLTSDDIKDLGFDYVFFGHEHSPFGMKMAGQTPVYRLGAMTRNSANEYNLKRTPSYIIINGGEIEAHTLDCIRDGEEVFTEEAFTQQNLKKKQFIENIHSVISRYQEGANTTNERFSIIGTLKELNAPENAIEHIRKKYDSLGLTFR